MYKMKVQDKQSIQVDKNCNADLRSRSNLNIVQIFKQFERVINNNCNVSFNVDINCRGCHK
jgi:hypothetical protein